MKSFKEFSDSQLDEGILDTVKDVVKSIGRGIGKTVVGAAKYGAQAVGAIPGGLLGGFKAGMSGGGGGYGYGGYGYKDRYGKKKTKVVKPAVKPTAKPASPKATGTTPAPKPPSGLGPKPTTPPSGAPTKVPSPTGAAPVPPATTTPSAPPPPAPVPAPAKVLTKAEKKDRRELARTSGGITDRLGKIEASPTYPTKGGATRAARTDLAKVKLAARGAELEAQRAALQTKSGKVRKGVEKSDIRKFNVSQEVTKGNILKQQSIAQNPELAKKLAAARAKAASKKAKSGQIMGAYESTDFLNSVLKFLNK